MRIGLTKREQDKLLKAFKEAVEVERLNSHSYKATLETGDTIKVSVVINCQMESALEIVLNKYCFYSGVRLNDELKKLFCLIQDSEFKFRDNKYKLARAKNLDLWDNILSV